MCINYVGLFLKAFSAHNYNFSAQKNLYNGKLLILLHGIQISGIFTLTKLICHYANAICMVEFLQFYSLGAQCS